MLNKKINVIIETLNIGTDTLHKLPNTYKKFNNINSVETFDNYLNHIDQGGFFCVFDLQSNCIHNSIEVNKDDESFINFFKVNDLIEIIDLYKTHKSVIFLDYAWSCDVLGGCRLICRFGDNLWKSFPINVI